MEYFFLLLVGHALADFALQTEAMARGKNRNRQIDLGSVPPGQKPIVCWHYWLSSHALIHGGMVALITGIWWLGLLETIVHWVIDFGKCENWYGIHEDQAMHIFCKVLYVSLFL